MSASTGAVPGPIISRVTVIRVVTLLAVWAIYEAASRSGLFFEGVVPSSFVVLRTMFETLASPEFYPHLFRTLTEVVSGFVVGVVAGVSVGIVFGSSRLIAGMISPWVNYLGPAPKIIFLPILLLVFGVGMGSKVAMAALSAFFPVVIATHAGMRHIPPVYLRVAKTFNASWHQIVTKVYIPALVAPVMTSFRLAIGVAFIGTLLAEIKLSNQGLGYLIIQHYNFLRIPEMYAVLLLTFMLAVAANASMGWLADRVEHERH
ncbi:ABC transporter permease [Amorphus sp. 3PC139-8]|uniref:ABC transporter permease n=1 Tax=Amorphus sp. 3PC139-8 TaxID=2735676 RepID=UPI00345DA6C3